MVASAIILAAGAGTRMKSSKPKVAHELLGKPLVNWVVDAAKRAGVENLVSVLGYERDQVIPLVEADTTIIFQEQLLGTADAVGACGQHFSDFSGSLLVLSGDCPLITSETIHALVSKREKEQAAVVVLTMNMSNPVGYGRIVRDEEGAIERIVEQKDCTQEEASITECNSGFYCFDARTLFSVLKNVDDNNAQNEFYLTDVLELCRRSGRIVSALQTAHVEECLGINSRSQLAQATKYMQRRINQRHMAAGVTMTDPDLVWIGPDVALATDVELLPLTFLFGETTVGSDCIIGPNSRLIDCVVGRGCVLEETIALGTRMENEVSCGPRAYLREGTHLCSKAKVGTHVEVKKSKVGEGSKVPHLSYIGDALIGKNVNIGAGTITCNYDGKNKHRTIIGDGAFVGSDTMLVAPVEVGENALIGAGSTITKDVTSGSLALARARQVEMPKRFAKTEEL